MSFIKKYLEKISCPHKYEFVGRTMIYDEFFGRSEFPNSIRETYLCSKCGKFKKIKL